MRQIACVHLELPSSKSHFWGHFQPPVAGAIMHTERLISVPGLIVMKLDDNVEHYDGFNHVVVVFNATTSRMPT